MVHITANDQGTNDMCAHHLQVLSPAIVYILLFCVSILTSYVPLTDLRTCLSSSVLTSVLLC